MCNLSQGVYEKGRVDAILDGIKNLVKNARYTAEQAMWMIGIPDAEQDMYLRQLN